MSQTRLHIFDSTQLYVPNSTPHLFYWHVSFCRFNYGYIGSIGLLQDYILRFSGSLFDSWKNLLNILLNSSQVLTKAASVTAWIWSLNWSYAIMAPLWICWEVVPFTILHFWITYISSEFCLQTLCFSEAYFFLNCLVKYSWLQPAPIFIILSLQQLK